MCAAGGRLQPLAAGRKACEAALVLTHDLRGLRHANGLREQQPGMACAALPFVVKRSSIYPPHTERICWGCDRWCPATHMVCGNGKERTEHPCELFGDSWSRRFKA